MLLQNEVLGQWKLGKLPIMSLLYTLLGFDHQLVQQLAKLLDLYLYLRPMPLYTLLGLLLALLLDMLEQMKPLVMLLYYIRYWIYW
jgi:hypothetical protein